MSVDATENVVSCILTTGTFVLMARDIVLRRRRRNTKWKPDIYASMYWCYLSAAIMTQHLVFYVLTGHQRNLYLMYGWLAGAALFLYLHTRLRACKAESDSLEKELEYLKSHLPQ
jgi:hypothetical protein